MAIDLKHERKLRGKATHLIMNLLLDQKVYHVDVVHAPDHIGQVGLAYDFIRLRKGKVPPDGVSLRLRGGHAGREELLSANLHNISRLALQDFRPQHALSTKQCAGVLPCE